MSPQFDDRAQKTLELAQSEARAMGHNYAGTEHLLLALVQVGFDAAPHLLGHFHLTTERLRSEIEKLVQRGDRPIQLGKLPLTPRASRAIEYAQAEAGFLKLTAVGPEYLFLGLCREPDGVASQVLRNLGVRPESLRSEVFRIRLEQFKVVERAVRPVRAGTAWKRKTREELLAHLTAIYDEELERLHDPDQALKAATERFGEPTELSLDLTASLSRSERRAYLFERWFGWRAPETAFRFVLRQALLSFLIIAAIWCIPLLTMLVTDVDNQRLGNFGRIALAMLFFAPMLQLTVGWLYYSLRDAMFGPSWASKSRSKAIVFDALIALSVATSLFGFVGLIKWNLGEAIGSLAWIIPGAIATAIGFALAARHRGPVEIADTVWACMDLASAAPAR
jgi:hypothetical protein